MSSEISKEALEKINNAWLNVDVPSKFIANPLSILRTDDPEEFRKKLTWLLMQPDYFYFLCKHIFNIELLPMQCLILKEMWERKFPMLIASRGAGKALRPDEMVRVENGWKPIKDINVGDQVYSSDGKLCNVTYKTERQTGLNMYKVSLSDGREIECCEDHLWIVHNGKRPNVLATKEIIRRINEGEVLSIPANEPIQEQNKKFNIPPYIVGLICGRKNNETSFYSIDKQVIIDHLRGFVDDEVPLSGHYHTNIRSLPVHYNEVPEEYKYGSVTQKYSLLSGLLDSSGISDDDGIRFVTENSGLSKDFEDIARSLSLCVATSYDGTSYTSRIFFDKTIQITNISPSGKSDGYCIKVDSYDHTYITKDYIVTHNTFLLSLYCLIRAFLMPKRKIVVVGAAFRQSKFLHDYMENIWKNAPVFRDLCDDNSGPRRDVDMCKMSINGSTVVALPIGDGSKIIGQRANDIIADEFASMSRDIFENVIAGFAAVSASPAENVRRVAAIEESKRLNVEPPKEIKASEDKTNQIILSGTAFYDFNHFSEYWKKWKSIIETKGDPRAISQNIFNGEDPPESFKWDDYSVIRIPFDMIPRGFMDEGQIARSKATIHNGIFLMEFGAVFAKDSQGFFKRSLIESCVGTDSKPVSLPSGDVYFDPMLRGNPNKKYIMGVDPASEVDNFSIIVLEVNEDHRRIVYCWTTTRKEHTERVQRGLTTENNFYSYCARKIRELMDLFPVCHIAMDAQGGGIAVSEALHDKNQLRNGEIPIWPVIVEGKEKPTDDQAGLHILELCQFAKYDWYSEANHGLRKDLEDKLIVFPRFDPITIGLSIEEDKQKNRLYDTLEDCVMEIEELKNELSLIEITRTDNGRERWDTPEVKIGVGKKERMRKDRYSALLMANMAARVMHLELKQASYHSYGGFATVGAGPEDKKVSYVGPEWFTSSVKDLYTSY